jgi:peptidoglycan hydrolase-like protein with peptidoglycan-binding domain
LNFFGVGAVESRCSFVMKRLALSLLLLAVSSFPALGDQQIREVQEELKDQGFYYGEIDGQPGGETAAAIKRFQIRNGLEVTGTATKETIDSLGLGGAGSAAKNQRRSAPPVTVSPTQPRPPASSRTEDRTEESDRDYLRRSAPRGAPPNSPEPGLDDDDPSVVDPPVRIPPPSGASGALGDDFADLFAGTPYESAPTEVQESTLRRVQSLLARQGYYRDPIDGLPGPATEEAILAYQRGARLELTGQLDLETLGTMRLLPGRGGPPMQRFRSPTRRSSGTTAYRGRWVD